MLRHALRASRGGRLEGLGMQVIRRVAGTTWLACVAIALSLPGTGLAEPPTRTKSPAWSPVACTAFTLQVEAGSGVECGYVTVPRRHADPKGPTIQLAAVVLPATASPRQPDPLFLAQGGPGGSTIETYGTYLLDSPDARPAANRDIVLWDQRGTLYSKPALMCPELSKEALESAQRHESDAESDAASMAAFKACGARLQAEAGDLSVFNSAENADDVDDVRRALGYDTINFYGVSYGTELGQFVMRQHPAELRSVILDAVVPLSYNLFTEPAFAQQRIGEKYLRGCAAEPTCNAAFPDLARRYLALVDRLNTTPVTVQVAPLDSTETHQVVLTGDLLEAALYTSLYTNVHDYIPLIVDRADHGDYTYVSSLLLPMILFDTTMAEGMHQTVACADRGDTDARATEFAGVLPRLAKSAREDAIQAVAMCREWKIELLPRAALEPVTSEIPTLLLSGDFDPITPPQYAASLLPQLAHGQHVVFPRGSHGQAVQDACANRIIQAFLDEPRRAVDASCVATAVPKFATSNDVIFLRTARRLMARSGFLGMLRLGLFAVPAVLCAALLLTAVATYPIGALVRRLRGRPRVEAPTALSRRLSRAAPWLAVAAALLVLVFVAGFVLAVGSTLAANQNLVAMAAIPVRWRWLFRLPPIVAVIALAMVAATIALWKWRQRSFAGRIYFTLLTVAGIVAAGNLLVMGR
jgi:pimeloyl-ACP methyl ester carboxylesterase